MTISRTAIAAALALTAVGAGAGAAIAQRAAPAPLQVPNPHYVAIPMVVTVNKPAKEVWDRVGKFCDIGEWLMRNPAACTITSGETGAGDFGSVRTVGSEIEVGRTPLSYTYTQPVREGQVYNMYHGTLEARPVSATTTELHYTIFFDDSMIPEDQREANVTRFRTTFTNALNSMKILAEGGELPAPPARR